MSELNGLKNKTKSSVVASKVRMATTFLARLKGLLGTDCLNDGEALYLKPCNSIHMFGMKYPIDAVFLNDKLIVVALVKEIQPGEYSKRYKEASACLELPAGTVERFEIEEGDQLEWRETNTANDTI